MLRLMSERFEYSTRDLHKGEGFALSCFPFLPVSFSFKICLSYIINTRGGENFSSLFGVFLL